MHSHDKTSIQRALVNVTKSERSAVGFPADFAQIPWESLDFLGWRDPRFPQRGYLVRETPDGLLAVMLQTTAQPRGVRRKAMCAVCRAVDSADSVSLFAARRAGPAGRKGDTVGTYVCTGLDCSAQLRAPEQRAGRVRLDGRDADVDAVAAHMLDRLDGFLAAVTTTTG